MIAKGNLHGNGGKLARYLMTGELGEDVEFVEARGLDGFGADPVAAFEALQDTLKKAVSKRSHAEKEAA